MTALTPYTHAPKSSGHGLAAPFTRPFTGPHKAPGPMSKAPPSTAQEEEKQVSLTQGTAATSKQGRPLRERHHGNVGRGDVKDRPPPQWVLYCTESGASTLQRALLRRGMNIFHQRRNENPFCLPIQPCPPFSLSLPTSLPPPACVFVVVVTPPPPPTSITPPLSFTPHF